jgi:hypothetical protein
MNVRCGQCVLQGDVGRELLKPSQDFMR